MTSSPHDALFKATFSQVEHAAGELRRLLPEALAARVDFATLSLRPGSFVDEALQERHTDLLFSASLSGREVLFYLLFEHQSTVDPWMAFRLLRYIVRVWEAHLKEHPDARRLPAVVPLVLHHGESGWTAPTAVEELLDLDPLDRAALGEHTPRLRFLLDDLSGATDEALRGRAMTALGRLVLFCLRSARSPEQLVAGLRAWIDVVREARRAPNGAAALTRVWRYIFEINDHVAPEELLARLAEAAGEDGKDELMSVADQLIEQGRREGLREGHLEGLREGHREGLREGLQEGQRALLLKQLVARFGPLPEIAAAAVRAATAAQLETWAERVLSAATLADVLSVD